MTEISYRGATTEELPLILALQRQNLARAISPAEALAQGFVTVEHDLALLTAMNCPHAHTIATAADGLAGYALTMTADFRDRIPVLDPLFSRLDQLEWRGHTVGDLSYVVMGQVCVAKKYRGRGVFTDLYRTMAARMGPYFEVIITEISERNTRSLRAHAKVGFADIHRYTDPQGERWVVVGWPV
ncbi:MAG: GNAT family N-acetyltransferase [Bacteroidota bacterium]